MRAQVRKIRQLQRSSCFYCDGGGGCTGQNPDFSELPSGDELDAELFYGGDRVLTGTDLPLWDYGYDSVLELVTYCADIVTHASYSGRRSALENSHAAPRSHHVPAVYYIPQNSYETLARVVEIAFNFFQDLKALWNSCNSK